MTSVGPPVLMPVAHGGEPDSDLHIVSIHFGHRNPGDYKPDLYAPNRYEFDNGKDEVTGVIYPASQLTQDDLGRQVAQVNYRGQGEDDWLI